MEKLQTMIEECHPHVNVYMQAYCLMQDTSLLEYWHQLNFCKGTNWQQYNLPTADNKLALIIPGDRDTLVNMQQILLQP